MVISAPEPVTVALTQGYCQAFSSGPANACFYNLGLSRLGFEHPILRMRVERSNRLGHRAAVDLIILDSTYTYHRIIYYTVEALLQIIFDNFADIFLFVFINLYQKYCFLATLHMYVVLFYNFDYLEFYLRAFRYGLRIPFCKHQLYFT